MCTRKRFTYSANGHMSLPETMMKMLTIMTATNFPNGLLLHPERGRNIYINIIQFNVVYDNITK